MNRKQPLKETFARIGGKQPIHEKKDAIWTWDEINDSLTWIGMIPRRIADIRTALKKYTKK